MKISNIYKHIDIEKTLSSVKFGWFKTIEGAKLENTSLFFKTFLRSNMQEYHCHSASGLKLIELSLINKGALYIYDN